MLRIAALRRGDIVRNLGSGDSFVVVDAFGASAMAVRTVTVTNPDEWVLVPDEPVRAPDLSSPNAFDRDVDEMVSRNPRLFGRLGRDD